MFILIDLNDTTGKLVTIESRYEMVKVIQILLLKHTFWLPRDFTFVELFQLPKSVK